MYPELPGGEVADPVVLDFILLTQVVIVVMVMTFMVMVLIVKVVLVFPSGGLGHHPVDPGQPHYL